MARITTERQPCRPLGSTAGDKAVSALGCKPPRIQHQLVTAHSTSTEASALRRPGSEWLGVLALVVTAVLWGTNHVTARAVHDIVPLPALSFWRWFLALVILVPLAVPYISRDRVVIRRDLTGLLIAGVFGVGVFSLLLYLGAYHSLAMEVGLLNATTPVWVVILAALLRSSRPTLRQAAGLTVATIGIAVVLTRGQPGAILDFRPTIGNLCAVLAAVVFAGFSMAIPRYTRELAALSFTAVTAGGATVLIFLPLYLAWLGTGGAAFTIEGTDQFTGLAGLVYIALGPTLIANVLWAYGTARVGATRAGAFLYLSPLTSSVLSIVILSEEVHLFHGASFLLILAGLALLTWPSGSRRQDRDKEA